MIRLVIIAAVVALSGCADMDRMRAVKFKPTVDGFEYEGSRPFEYGQETFDRWLVQTVEASGVCPSGYDVVSNKRISLGTSLFGPVEHDYITGKCKSVAQKSP